MRALKYRLADGTITAEWNKAVKSGQFFEVVLEEIPKPAPKLSPKRQAIIEANNGIFRF